MGRLLDVSPSADQDRPLYASGFHRLAFFFLGLASVAVWTYVLDSWFGGERWGLLLALVAGIPIGLVFSILPSILLGALRRLPALNDALLTWFSSSEG